LEGVAGALWALTERFPRKKSATGTVPCRKQEQKRGIMPLDPLILIGLGLFVVVAVAIIALRQRNSGITTIASAPPPAQPLPPSAAPLAPSGDLAIEVRQWLAQSSKIEVIKRVRQRTNLGLKEAKDYVEAVEVGQSPIIPTSANPPAPSAAGDLNGQIHALLAKNQKIQAIKLVREQTGWGLKEAKDYVDALE
jgi:ribosomal protein L7/L12